MRKIGLTIVATTYIVYETALANLVCSSQDAVVGIIDVAVNFEGCRGYA